MPSFKLKPSQIGWLKAAIHAICLYLLASVYYRGFTDKLGADPVEAIIHYTGIGALNLLLLTLLVTPLSKLIRQPLLMRVRRPLGLYSFFWACCHITNYLAFELQWIWGDLLSEIIKRPYLLVGFTAWLILLVLAITSIPALVRWLGRRWKPLHRLIYWGAPLVVIHFWWSVKADISEPMLYLGLVLLLLIVRWRKAPWRKGLR